MVDADGRPVGLLDITDLIGGGRRRKLRRRAWPETWRREDEAMQTVPCTLAERCRAVRLLVLDVDGVLTDGGIVYGTGGLEVKQLPRPRRLGPEALAAGGQALAPASRAGRRRWWTCGRPSWASISSSRGRRTSCRPTGDCWKKRRLTPRRSATSATTCRTCRRCATAGWRSAVADACREARAAAHYVTRTPGGGGAVREVIELILRCQGEWERLAERLRNPEF